MEKGGTVGDYGRSENGDDLGDGLVEGEGQTNPKPPTRQTPGSRLVTSRPRAPRTDLGRSGRTRTPRTQTPW